MCKEELECQRSMSVSGTGYTMIAFKKLCYYSSCSVHYLFYIFIIPLQKRCKRDSGSGLWGKKFRAMKTLCKVKSGIFGRYTVEVCDIINRRQQISCHINAF